MVHTGAFHQMVSRRPVAMTVEERADDAAAEHSRKCFLISLGLKLSDNLVALLKATDVQAVFIRGPATKARIVWRVSFLNALHSGIVQSPKSKVQTQELDSAVHSPSPVLFVPRLLYVLRQLRVADVGLWTLDFGLFLSPSRNLNL